MSIAEILVVAVAGSVFAVLLSQHRPEFSVIIRLAAVMCIIACVSVPLAELSNDLIAFADDTKINREYILLLLKALVISVSCHIVSDICADAGNKAISSCVELSGRAAVVILAIPMLKALTEVARELINA